MPSKLRVRAVLLAAIAIGTTMVAAPAAQAAGDSISGGCFADIVKQDLVTNSENQGFIGDASVTTNSAGPVGAAVTCYITVNGTEPPGTRHTYTGTGLQVGEDFVAYPAGPTDDVELCQSVAFADGVTTSTACLPSVRDVMLPNPAVAPVNEIFPNDIDPAVCPALQDLSGVGIPGVLDIGPDGDVYIDPKFGLGADPVYDCPPYGNF